jgi:hypothetical protein
VEIVALVAAAIWAIYVFVYQQHATAPAGREGCEQFCVGFGDADEMQLNAAIDDPTIEEKRGRVAA